MLNSFQHLFRLPEPTAQEEEWALKQVQGDDFKGVNIVSTARFRHIGFTP